MRKTFLASAASICAGLSLSIAAAASAGQQPTAVVEGDEITIRGCVGRAEPGVAAHNRTLIWTRGDIMLGNATALDAVQLQEQVFYWLDDDEDLGKHIGQLIEIKGELEDFEAGELKIERDGDFTEIELKLDGRTEEARVPSAWLGVPRDEGEFEIASRKIDVEEVKVLGACPVR